MEPLARTSVVDTLERQIQQDIFAGSHQIGTLLPPERNLAESYGVTRATLKHALGRLVGAGLLETRHGVGTRVRDYLRTGGADLLPMLVRFAPDWLHEVFEVRRSMGAVIAQRAAGRITARQADELRSLLTAVGAADRPAAIQLADAEVHRALARATGNRVYLLLTNTLFNAYFPARKQLVGPFQEAEVAHARLAPLVRAVCAGDPEAAARAADVYLQETERIMLGDLGLAQ